MKAKVTIQKGEIFIDDEGLKVKKFDICNGETKIGVVYYNYLRYTFETYGHYIGDLIQLDLLNLIERHFTREFGRLGIEVEFDFRNFLDETDYFVERANNCKNASWHLQP